VNETNYFGAKRADANLFCTSVVPLTAAPISGATISGAMRNQRQAPRFTERFRHG
jgi:hypothetical protein